MRMNKVRAASFATVIAMICASCGSSSNGDKDKNSAEFKAAEEGLKQQIEDVVYNIPSPSEIPYVIQSTGAEFNASLINPRTNVDQYTTQNEKAALNLGVYVADIGYLASYDKTQQAIDYLNSSKSLAENLGVVGSFDIDLLKEFEANISNKDSLARILDNTTRKTEAFLKDEHRNQLAALVITGSFVEGLYISTGIVRTYPRNILPDDAMNLVLSPLIRIILEQKKSVTELSRMLEPVEGSDELTAMKKDIKDLENIYAQLNIEEQIRNNRADLVLSDKNLDQISVIVSKLRKEITG